MPFLWEAHCKAMWRINFMKVNNELRKSVVKGWGSLVLNKKDTLTKRAANICCHCESQYCQFCICENVNICSGKHKYYCLWSIRFLTKLPVKFIHLLCCSVLLNAVLVWLWNIGHWEINCLFNKSDQQRIWKYCLIIAVEMNLLQNSITSLWINISITA